VVALQELREDRVVGDEATLERSSSETPIDR